MKKSYLKDVKGLLQLTGLVLVVLLVLSIPFGNPVYRWGTIDRDVMVSVKSKERVNKGWGENAKSYYLVYGEEETFTVQDDWWNLRFRASDTYGSMEEGQKYLVRVTGWRIPIFSQYRNILDVESAD